MGDDIRPLAVDGVLEQGVEQQPADDGRQQQDQRVVLAAEQQERRDGPGDEEEYRDPADGREVAAGLPHPARPERDGRVVRGTEHAEEPLVEPLRPAGADGPGNEEEAQDADRQGQHPEQDDQIGPADPVDDSSRRSAQQHQHENGP